MTDDFIKASEAARQTVDKARDEAATDVQSLISKTATDKAISGAELLDILHGFGLIPKPVPTPKPPVKK